MYSKTVVVSDPKIGLRFNSEMEFFESATGLYEVTESRIPFRVDDKLSRKWHDEDWCGGVDSTEEAVRMLYGGWEDKVPEARLRIREVEKTLPKNSRAIKNAVVGFAPVVPLAIMGVPECMSSDARKPVKSRVISIYYDFGATFGVSAEDLTWAGMRALAEIVKLEKTGYRVRLFGVHWQSNEYHGNAAVVKLKSEYAPIDLKRMLFPMVHPAYFRIIHLGWYNRCPTKKYIQTCGCSIYNRPQREVDAIIEQCFGPKAIYISAAKMISRKYSEEYVDNYLKRNLEKVGVKTETL